MNIRTGNAPCGGCGKHIWNIPLDFDSIEADGSGGYWCKVARPTHCQNCGEPLIWFHKPADVVLDANATTANRVAWNS